MLHYDPLLPFGCGLLPSFDGGGGFHGGVDGGGGGLGTSGSGTGGSLNGMPSLLTATVRVMPSSTKGTLLC